MAFPENRLLDLNANPASPADALNGAGKIMKVDQMSDKGYSIDRGAAAVFAGKIQGSVSGQIWGDISVIAADAQGAVAAHYNFVRLLVSTPGAIDGTVIKIAGKVL